VAVTAKNAASFWIVVAVMEPIGTRRGLSAAFEVIAVMASVINTAAATLAKGTVIFRMASPPST